MREEEPGLHPVQPEPRPILDHDDLAPSIKKMKSHWGQEKIILSSSAVNRGSEPEAYHKDRTRICGLRRLTFWLLFGIIILLVVTGAVAGGVMGSRARHE